MEYSNSMDDTLSLEEASMNMSVSYLESSEEFSSSDFSSSDSDGSDSDSSDSDGSDSDSSDSDSSDSDSSSSSSDSGSMEDYSLELADPTDTFDAFDVLLVKCNTEYDSVSCNYSLIHFDYRMELKKCKVNLT